MIGYDRLGSNGRFGNQMFQYAALRGIAAHHGYEWCIPPVDHYSYSNYGIHHAFNTENVKTGFINKHINNQAMMSLQYLQALNYETPSITESVYHFDEDLFNNFPDNTNLDGYLQTEKYFKHIEDEIRNDFTFKDEILKPCEEFISQYEKIIFLHVRRGDMVNIQQSHSVMSIDYFTRALKYFDEDSHVLICSDDPEWCEKQELFSDNRFLLNTNVPEFDHYHMDGDGVRRKSKVPYTDMCLMSLCNGAILSASSMGWWGAWLQKNRTNPVIVPKDWYGPQLAQINNIKDLYPEDWTVIPN